MATRGAIRELEGLPNWPLMLSAPAAAAFVGLTEKAFLAAVAAGELPRPRKLAGRDLWLRTELERWLDPGASHAASAATPRAAAADDIVTARIKAVRRAP